MGHKGNEHGEVAGRVEVGAATWQNAGRGAQVSDKTSPLRVRAIVQWVVHRAALTQPQAQPLCAPLAGTGAGSAPPIITPAPWACSPCLDGCRAFRLLRLTGASPSSPAAGAAAAAASKNSAGVWPFMGGSSWPMCMPTMDLRHVPRSRPGGRREEGGGGRPSPSNTRARGHDTQVAVVAHRGQACSSQSCCVPSIHESKVPQSPLGSLCALAHPHCCPPCRSLDPQIHQSPGGATPPPASRPPPTQPITHQLGTGPAARGAGRRCASPCRRGPPPPQT